MPSLLKMTKDKFEKQAERIDRIIGIARGRVDIKKRLNVLLNPENVETSTRLTKTQVQFVSMAFSAAEQWPFFEPLKNYATHLCLTNISLDGKGREEIIRYMGAISESKLLMKMGLIKGETEK